MSIQQKKFKKYLKELQFNKSELEFVQEILKEAHLEFERYYRQYCEDKDIDIQSLNEKNKEKVDKMIPDPRRQKHDKQGIMVQEKVEFVDNTDSKHFKKLYREAVKKCHPDKGGDETEFKKLSKAHDEKDWEALLDICERNSIEVDDYKEINKILKKQIEIVKGKINKEKSTYSWSLYQCEDNKTCKENVVKKFLKHLFDYGEYK